MIDSFNKQCSKCGHEYHHEWVFKKGPGTSPVCKYCRNPRGRGKNREPIIRKVADVISRHAKSLGIPKDRLIEIYGWDPLVLKDQLETILNNPESRCPYTGRFFKKLPSGGFDLSDISLDIIHRDKKPFLLNNTRWVSRLGNTLKGKDNDRWEAERNYVTRWQKWNDAGGYLVLKPQLDLFSEVRREHQFKLKIVK
jgi:hypothetical protein